MPTLTAEDDEASCYALLAAYANQVNSIRQQLVTPEDIKAITMPEFDRRCEQVTS